MISRLLWVIIICLLVFIFAAHGAYSEDNLWLAICLQESGNDADAPDGDGGEAVGIAQIHAGVVVDCNMILGSDTFTLLSRKDVVKSRQMFFVYTRYWCSKKGLPYTVTTAARVWNGGPDGNTKPHTVEYAKNVLRRIS